MGDKETSNRIDILEKRLDEHIHDGIGVWKGIEQVKTDVTWIKRGLWALVILGTTINGLLVKFVLLHTVLKP